MLSKTNAPPPPPQAGGGWPNDAMILCLADGSTVGIQDDTRVEAQINKHASARTDTLIRVFNVRTSRVELVRASAILRVIMPEGGRARG